MVDFYTNLMAILELAGIPGDKPIHMLRARDRGLKHFNRFIRQWDADIARARYQGNTFAAWKEGTPIQNRLIEAILDADIHIIATMRSKTEYSLTKDDKGKTKPEKVGTAPIQRDGFEYEYDVIIDLGIDNVGVVNKTRCPSLAGKVIEKPGAALADTLREWLHGAPAQKSRRYGDGTPVGNKAGAIRAYDAYMELSDTPPDSYEALREWAEEQKAANSAAA